MLTYMLENDVYCFILFIYLNLCLPLVYKSSRGKCQQKYILNYTNNKLDIVIKLVYLRTKHPQSIFPRFSILVLNSKAELLNLILAGRLFHIREPLAFVP